MTTESPRWFTASYSNNDGACVEVATNLVAARDIVPVRDSKVPTGPALAVRATAFASFIDSIKADTLDA
ncbi:DUF397 domain-containing protein [Streptomyces laurentii]|uniref:DUF397 domain-containing protein n=1 Tax=Streptomyces laurentii TaxID=39478 RepID=UPI0036C3964F